MTTPPPQGALNRKLIILAVVVIVAIGGWSAAWMFIRSEVGRRMDDQFARLRDRGIEISCPDRRIGGWPFRIDVDCRAPRIEMPERLLTATAKALRVTALIYQPTRVIIELDGPVRADGPNGQALTADWSLLQASVGLSGARPEQVSIVTDGINGTITQPGGKEAQLTADHLELHGRPNPETGAAGDMDLAARLAKATITVNGKQIGPPDSDVDVDAIARHLPTASGDTGTFLKRWAGNDGRVELKALRYHTLDFVVQGKGDMVLEASGLLTGSVKLIASGFESLLTSDVRTAKAKAALALMATAFTLYGSAVTDAGTKGRSLELSVAQGRLKVGSFSFGHLPPLF